VDGHVVDHTDLLETLGHTGANKHFASRDFH